VIVVVGPDRPPLLGESDDCNRFHVVLLPGGDLAAGAEALGGSVTDDGDVLVPVAFVRAHATAPAAALDGMLAFASTKGWLEGDLIRAHVEAG
jgi:hypothetical protein